MQGTTLNRPCSSACCISSTGTLSWFGWKHNRMSSNRNSQQKNRRYIKRFRPFYIQLLQVIKQQFTYFSMPIVNLWDNDFHSPGHVGICPPGLHAASVVWDKPRSWGHSSSLGTSSRIPGAQPKSWRPSCWLWLNALSTTPPLCYKKNKISDCIWSSQNLVIFTFSKLAMHFIFPCHATRLAYVFLNILW